MLRRGSTRPWGYGGLSRHSAGDFLRQQHETDSSRTRLCSIRHSVGQDDVNMTRSDNRLIGHSSSGVQSDQRPSTMLETLIGYNTEVPSPVMIVVLTLRRGGIDNARGVACCKQQFPWMMPHSFGLTRGNVTLN